MLDSLVDVVELVVLVLVLAVVEVEPKFDNEISFLGFIPY